MLLNNAAYLKYSHMMKIKQCILITVLKDNVPMFTPICVNI